MATMEPSQVRSLSSENNIIQGGFMTTHNGNKGMKLHGTSNLEHSVLSRVQYAKNMSGETGSWFHVIYQIDVSGK